MTSGVTTRCAWPGRGESVTELTPFRNFLLHSYTCCSDRHASSYWTSICWWSSMGLTPSLRKKTNDRSLFLFGACCKWGRHLYTIAAPSCCVPPSYCHLLATLQTMSIIVANLQDNWVVFRIFITLLGFSFDSLLYMFTNNILLPHVFCKQDTQVAVGKWAFQHSFHISVLKFAGIYRKLDIPFTMSQSIASDLKVHHLMGYSRLLHLQ